MCMKVFAISDLHLSTAVHKPMDVFGVDWDNYFEKITADWKEISPPMRTTSLSVTFSDRKSVV